MDNPPPHTSWIEPTDTLQMAWIHKYLSKKNKGSDQIPTTNDIQSGYGISLQERKRMESAWRSYKSRQENRDKSVITVSRKCLRRIQAESKKLKITKQEYMEQAMRQEISIRQNKLQRIGTRPYFFKRQKLKRSVHELIKICETNPSDHAELLENIRKQAELIAVQLKKFDDGVNWSDIEPPKNKQKTQE